MNFDQFFKVVPYVLGPKVSKSSSAPEGYPVMMRGETGVGKSEVVEFLSRCYNLPIVEQRASQMTEGDLVGLPKIEGGITRWLHPEWYVRACKEPVVLFLDELDRAFREVRQGFFQMADSRCLNGLRLHPGTKIVCAINGGIGSTEYLVNEMGRAELDRWWIVNIEPTAEDWLHWASRKPNEKDASLEGLIDEITKNYKKFGKLKTNVHGFVTDFITKNKHCLSHHRDLDPTKIYPSPRSWKRFSDVCTKAGLFENLNKMQDGDFMLIQAIAEGFVGLETSVQLTDFKEKYESDLSVEELIDLNSGAKEKYKNFTLQQNMEMIQKIRNSRIFEEDMDDPKIYALVDYAFHLQKELYLEMWAVVCNKNSTEQNIIHWHVADIPTDPEKAMCEVLADAVSECQELVSQYEETHKGDEKED